MFAVDIPMGSKEFRLASKFPAKRKAKFILLKTNAIIIAIPNIPNITIRRIGRRLITIGRLPKFGK